MSELNWNRVFAISSFVVAVILVSGSIYLHIRHKPHLGRMHYDYDERVAVTTAGVEAAIINTTPFALHESIEGEAAEHDFNYAYQYEDLNDYSFSNNTEDEEEEEEVKADAYANVNEAVSRAANLALSLQWMETNREKEAHNIGHGLTTTALSEACMQCICETVSECSASTCGADKAPCGLYRISRPYWIDAGQLQLKGDTSAIDDIDMGYSHCVNNLYCSARTVAAFIKKYSRDCNADGIINCRDYIAMHIQGASGCVAGSMQPVFQSRMEKCLAKFT